MIRQFLYRCGSLLLACGSALLAVSLAGQLTGAEPQKLAFIVGVDHYLRDGLNDLNYTDDDATELARTLEGLEFKVDLLTGEQTTVATIRARFNTFVERTKLLTKEDIVLVSFSGHGLEREIRVDGALASEPFFCPRDANKGDVNTLLSLNGVMRQLGELSGSSTNLILIDACRDDTTKGARSLTGGTVRELPAKLSVLFACSSGQRSYESTQVKHGVFTHVLLEGLQGKARDENGEITWLDIATYVTKNVPRRAPTLLDDANAVQNPNFINNTVRLAILSTSKLPRPVVPGGKELTNGIGMKLILIPAGEFEMDSIDDDAEKPVHQQGDCAILGDLR